MIMYKVNEIFCKCQEVSDSPKLINKIKKWRIEKNNFEDILQEKEENFDIAMLSIVSGTSKNVNISEIFNIVSSYTYEGDIKIEDVILKYISTRKTCNDSIRELTILEYSPKMETFLYFNIHIELIHKTKFYFIKKNKWTIKINVGKFI